MVRALLKLDQKLEIAPMKPAKSMSRPPQSAIPDHRTITMDRVWLRGEAGEGDDGVERVEGAF
jgi:hypothetical protein